MKSSGTAESVISGCYILILNLLIEKRINIGKLGLFSFKGGDYFYVGSAKNGIASRVNRHINSKVKHWHIDYLKAKTKIHGVIEIPGLMIQECEIQKMLCEILICPVSGFGSSDCKCQSHLFYSEQINEGIAGIQAKLKSNKIKFNYVQFE